MQPPLQPPMQMSVLSGPYEFGEAPPHLAAQHEGLFCLQSYLVPGRDLRYIAAYDLSEGPLCTVLGRRHSARYTHALDDPAPSLPLEAVSEHGAWHGTGRDRADRAGRWGWVGFGVEWSGVEWGGVDWGGLEWGGWDAADGLRRVWVWQRGQQARGRAAPLKIRNRTI